MSKLAMGAIVLFCGHKGCFLADIWRVGDVNIIHASRPVDPGTLDREAKPTHHLQDFPKAGFWKPRIGVFVVPCNQCQELATSGDTARRRPRRATDREFRALVDNLDPRIRVPLSIGFWPRQMAVAWLKSNQRQPKKGLPCPRRKR